MGDCVSDQLTINAHGLRLITQFEGAPRLKARLCEGGRWELSYGVTFYPDGAPVQEGDTCTHEEAMAIFRHALSVFEDAVRRNVKVPMNSNQFSAYTIFCYNVGEAQFASSTVLKRINERRYDDAAEAMGAWIYATLGQHKQALRGLARRQYATGCLAMGYDWEVACSDDAIALVRERPPNDIGTDRVLFKTKFTDVLSVAQRYPLPPLDEPELVLSTPIKAEPPTSVIEAAGKAGQPVPLPGPAPAAPASKTSASGSSEAVSVKPTVPAPQPVPSARPAPASVPAVIPAPVGTKTKSPNTVAPADVPYRIDPQAGLKPLEETDRAKGYWYQQAGIGVIRLGSLGMFGTTLQGGAQALQGDPVLSNLVLTAVVLGGVTMTGYVVKVYGDWKRKRGEKSATQGMY
jgi:GH24 family phage-related lysozyme (muramidase)